MPRSPAVAVPRTEFVTMRLTAQALADLDRLRSGKTRSAYLRELLASAADNERHTRDPDRP